MRNFILILFLLTSCSTIDVEERQSNFINLNKGQFSENVYKLPSFNIFSVNGKLVRNNILVNLMNENCSSNVYGTSLLENKQHLDNFIVISHLIEN